MKPANGINPGLVPPSFDIVRFSVAHLKPLVLSTSCSDTPGDGYCMHGDFINGWYEDAAADMLIGGGSGRDDGRFISGAIGSSPMAASCTPKDADPENGTSDYWTHLTMMENGGVLPAPVPETPTTTAPSVPEPTVSLEPTPSACLSKDMSVRRKCQYLYKTSRSGSSV